MKREKRVQFLLWILMFSMLFMVSKDVKADINAKSTKLNATEIIKLDNQKQNCMTVIWKKISGASGYQIYYRNSPVEQYKKIKTVNAKTLKYTIKTASGKKYYFKVRAYKKQGNRMVYGAFSSERNATDIGATWYKKLLSSTKGSYRVKFQNLNNIKIKTVNRKDFTKYKVLDINKDGVKELILVTPEKNLNWKVLLLTYDKNKVKPLLCFDQNTYRAKIFLKGNTLVLTTGGSDHFYRVDYSIKSGELKKMRDMRYAKYDKYGNRVFAFYVNGKRVSENSYRSVSEKYSTDYTPELVYKKIQ